MNFETKINFLQWYVYQRNIKMVEYKYINKCMSVSILSVSVLIFSITKNFPKRYLTGKVSVQYDQGWLVS